MTLRGFRAFSLTTGCKLDRSNGLKMDTLVSG
jgi:hypothetical protein